MKKFILLMFFIQFAFLADDSAFAQQNKISASRDHLEKMFDRCFLEESTVRIGFSYTSKSEIHDKKTTQFVLTNLAANREEFFDGQYYRKSLFFGRAPKDLKKIECIETENTICSFFDERRGLTYHSKGQLELKKVEDFNFTLFKEYPNFRKKVLSKKSIVIDAKSDSAQFKANIPFELSMILDSKKKSEFFRLMMAEKKMMPFKFQNRNCMKGGFTKKNGDRFEFVVCPSLNYTVLKYSEHTRVGQFNRKRSYTIKEIPDDRKKIRLSRQLKLTNLKGEVEHWTRDNCLYFEISKLEKGVMNFLQTIKDETPVTVIDRQQIQYWWKNGKIRKKVNLDIINKIRKSKMIK